MDIAVPDAQLRPEHLVHRPPQALIRREICRPDVLEDLERPAHRLLGVVELGAGGADGAFGGLDLPLELGLLFGEQLGAQALVAHLDELALALLELADHTFAFDGVLIESGLDGRDVVVQRLAHGGDLAGRQLQAGVLLLDERLGFFGTDALLRATVAPPAPDAEVVGVGAAIAGRDAEDHAGAAAAADEVAAQVVQVLPFAVAAAVALGQEFLNAVEGLDVH